MSGNWQAIEVKLSEITNKSIHFINKESISGGCINQALKITDNLDNDYFIKTNSPNLENMFFTEALALQEIENSNTIRIPKVILTGSNSEFSYLILEYISLGNRLNQNMLGNQLAQLHLTKTSSNQENLQFGWYQNNYIGATLQSNKFHNDWVDFWKTERLLYQLNLAKSKRYPSKSYDAGLKLAESLSQFFSDYNPVPSLLHGDLWGGNCAIDINNKPVIYDPASYYGDREADIAMTELFGGFNADFYDSYNDVIKLDSGYKTRKTLYNLYHILNHYNLFGGGYASQADAMTRQLLSEL